MSTTPLVTAPPRGRGRLRFATVGTILRALKLLPAPMRERLLDASVSGTTSKLPPFGDLLRLVESAGGVPDGTRWQERLVEQRPELRGVSTRDINDDSKGRVRARLYLPPPGTAAPAAALVWVHGGAFLIGSLDQKEAHWPSIELAAAGIPVLSVDYRTCTNGVHYPAPQDDVLSAWRWATAHIDQLGVDVTQLHLGGGSAGGCLVAGVALRLRDNGEQLPASLFLAYPVLQGHLPPAPAEIAAELAGVANLPSDEWASDMFANWAGTASWSDPYVSPGLADPAQLPPTYVLTCGRDALRRASEPFVERLRAGGVTTWHDVLAASEHAPLDRPGTPDGVQAVNRLQTWLSGGIDAMEREPFVPAGPRRITDEPEQAMGTSAAMRTFSAAAGAWARRREDKPVDLARERRLNDRISNRLRVPTGVTMTSEMVGDVPVIRLSGGGAPRGIVMYLHGGAYVLGSARQVLVSAGLCKHGGPDLVSVEYRLAPEHPYPAALDDALAVYRQLSASSGSDRLVVLGESAGGGLVLSMLQHARDEGLPMPVAAIVAFPWADLTMSGCSTTSNIGKDFLVRSHLAQHAAWFAGSHDLDVPGISPIRGSFHAFPPTYIPVGTHDLLLDDARSVAAAMAAEGVDVTLDEWPGTTHAFTALPLPEGRRYRRQLRARVDALLPQPAPTEHARSGNDTERTS